MVLDDTWKISLLDTFGDPGSWRSSLFERNSLRLVGRNIGSWGRLLDGTPMEEVS